MKLVPLLLISMVMVLPACSTFTGLDSKSDFKCKAPEGVACESMSGIYANAEADNLPAQRISHRDAAKATQAQLTRAPSHERRKLPMPNATSSGQPLFRNPEILRIWVAPWEALIKRSMTKTTCISCLIQAHGILSTIALVS